MYCTNSALLHDTLLAELGVPPQTGFPSRMVDGEMKTPDQFAKEYLMYNLVRKMEPFADKADAPTAVIRASLTTFADTEYRSRVTNIFGSTYSSINADDTLLFQEAYRLAKVWISRALMDIWPRWDAVAFTGGASRNSSRKESMSCLKWIGYVQHGNMSATAQALELAVRESTPSFGPSWRGRKYDLVSNSRFDFVTKTAKAVRFMAMEPEMNNLMQKCLGDAFRYALKLQGINLDCQERNRALAFDGSVTGEVATLDQASSSDCVAMRLVDLFPARYREWILASRTPYTSVDGVHMHKLQKLATMGNGFIFELQSLIFAGFSYACTSLCGGRNSDVSVYGDDIVVSTCVAQPLMRTLEFYGLMPNMEKSFFESSDPFRESCGKHYFSGHDVTPFYVKEPLGRLRAKFRALNGLYYWQERTGIKIPKTLKLLVGLIPKTDRLIVPPTYSIDAGIHFLVNDGILPERRKSHGQLRYHFEYLTAVTEDITDILCDNARYFDWLRDQGDCLVPDIVWDKLLSSRRRPRSALRLVDVLPGVPRERREYGRGGLPTADYVRTNGNVGPAEIP